MFKTVLLGTQNSFKLIGKKIMTFEAKKYSLHVTCSMQNDVRNAPAHKKN